MIVDVGTPLTNLHLNHVATLVVATYTSIWKQCTANITVVHLRHLWYSVNISGTVQITLLHCCSLQCNCKDLCYSVNLTGTVQIKLVQSTVQRSLLQCIVTVVGRRREFLSAAVIVAACVVIFSGKTQQSRFFGENLNFDQAGSLIWSLLWNPECALSSKSKLIQKGSFNHFKGEIKKIFKSII